MDAEESLRLKIRLLTEGAVLPPTEDGGRRGGAGPVGSRYFILPNGRACGVVVRRGASAESYHAATLEPTDDPNVWIYDGTIELRPVPRPRFYDMHTADGTPYYKIALLHGDGTLATTAYQACRYWTTGTQCKFCTIPTSYLSGDTTLEKSPEQIVEVLRAAQNENVVRDVLITTGTPDSPDMGLNRIVEIVRAIREYSSIPVGIQCEPPTDTNLVKIAYDVGVNAVGMHIESADEQIRSSLCPGKHEYGPLSLYLRNWQSAVQLFGRGNVSTFILYGLGEDPNKTLSMLTSLSEMGVLSVVTPVRPAHGSHIAGLIPTYIGQLETTIEFFKEVGRILYRYRLDPSITAAGCHKCGACTPIQEAYDWAHHFS